MPAVGAVGATTIEVGRRRSRIGIIPRGGGGGTVPSPPRRPRAPIRTTSTRTNIRRLPPDREGGARTASSFRNDGGRGEGGGAGARGSSHASASSVSSRTYGSETATSIGIGTGRKRGVNIFRPGTADRSGRAGSAGLSGGREACGGIIGEGVAQP